MALLGKKLSSFKEVVQYYTYRHRKNSIAGGAVDEDGEPITGFMSALQRRMAGFLHQQTLSGLIQVVIGTG